MDEQMMELTQHLLNHRGEYQIEGDFSLEYRIETITRTSSYGLGSLNIVSCYGYQNVIQFLLINGVRTLQTSISSELVPYDPSARDEIKKLIIEICNLYASQEEISDNDYIEWSLTGSNLMKKAKEFREQIDLYKTYDNQHHLITKLLIEIIDYYLNDYLLKQGNLSSDQLQKIEKCFRKAIEEQNYLKYFIQAYTLANNFHSVLNKHLALYILCYFDPQSYSSMRSKYRLINCLVHIVTLLINHPDLSKYKYTGVTYRGLVMNEDDLKYYSIGNYILNKSFVSTSKDLIVAQTFANNREESVLKKTTTDFHDQRKVSVIFIYTIKQNGTAIDTKDLSMIEDEEEVLILPFSVFQIKDKIENWENTCFPELVEIYLEQCEDNEQKQENELSASLRQRSKYLYASIGVCILLSLVAITGCFIIIKILSNNVPGNEQIIFPVIRKRITPLRSTNVSLTSQARWSSNGITVAGGKERGNGSNQLFWPQGFYVDENQTIYVADMGNYRIMSWLSGSTNGQVVAVGNKQRNSFTHLITPSDVILDRENDSLIICDESNRRIMRWPRHNETQVETLVPNIDCRGLTIDNRGYLYVSDIKKHEVRRWRLDGTHERVIAGGHGPGNSLSQLDSPSYLFVDRNYSLYVSDRDNHRVMKWIEGAKEGQVVAGNENKGDDMNQLCKPEGIVVDGMGTIYVADYCNHRIVRWPRGAKQGNVLIGINGQGAQMNQLYGPIGLSFDRQGHLYVVDASNHRVQKFELLSL